MCCASSNLNIDFEWESNCIAPRLSGDSFEPSGPPVAIFRDFLRGPSSYSFSFRWFGHYSSTSVDLSLVLSGFWMRRCGSSVVKFSGPRCVRISGSKHFYLGCIKGKLDLMSPSGHSVASFPNQVLYSHASLVGTTEDLLSQMTKSKYHMIGQVIQITCKVMW
jgi:hypothetical protein